VTPGESFALCHAVNQMNLVRVRSSVLISLPKQEHQRRRGLKLGGAGSCNFSTDSSKFPTRKITGAQNFNFAPKFFQNGGFSAPNLVSSEEFFFDKKKIFGQFSDSPKFRGERVAGPCPFRATTLLYHMAFICILGVSVKIIIISAHQWEQKCSKTTATQSDE